MKKNWAIITILLLGLIFRIYNYEKGLSFAHDQDLYSWIAKDILINKHLRLVGQITSVDGVFIGPIYYYLMAITYFFFGMDPLSAVIPTTLIGLATIFSFYIFGRTYFNNKSGLIFAGIYSFSFGAAIFDRWSVPTQPTVLWSVWFLYLIFGLLRGNYKLIPFYGLMVGLVYHIHIALLPILPLPLLAYLWSGKKILWKYVLIGIICFFITSAPFWLFEIKHDFSQVKSTIEATKKDLGLPTGWPKFKKITNASAKEIQQRLVVGLESIPVEMLWILIGFGLYLITKNKSINIQQLVFMIGWIALIGLAQFTSKRIVSEYYFTNFIPIIVTILGLAIGYLNKNILVIMGAVYFIANTSWMIRIIAKESDSYYFRKKVVEFIKEDSEKRSLPCVGINYIAKFGTGFGFRYIFWKSGVEVVKTDGSDIPNYDIVIPWQISEKNIDTRYGRFGVISPKGDFKYNQELCRGRELDPMLGYTE